MIPQQHTLYLGLGGNIGDSHRIFDEAITALAEHITIGACSTRYVTPAMYVTEQADFLNMALRAKTALAPETLLTLCKDIEARFGRDFALERYGPRPLDIDILYYGDAVIKNDSLTIPHPLMYERAFVLEPLLEVVPADFCDPVLQQSIAALVHALGANPAAVNA